MVTSSVKPSMLHPPSQEGQATPLSILYIHTVEFFHLLIHFKEFYLDVILRYRPANIGRPRNLRFSFLFSKKHAVKSQSYFFSNCEFALEIVAMQHDCINN